MNSEEICSLEDLGCRILQGFRIKLKGLRGLGVVLTKSGSG